MSHSPEPWTAEVDPSGHWYYVRDADDKEVFRVPYFKPLPEYPNHYEYLTRIVACVNACAGIPTEVVHVFCKRMMTALVMASELSEPVREISEQLLVKHLELSVKLLNKAGFHWEKNT